VTLAEDQDVVEAFAANAAQEPLVLLALLAGRK